MTDDHRQTHICRARADGQGCLLEFARIHTHTHTSDTTCRPGRQGSERVNQRRAAEEAGARGGSFILWTRLASAISLYLHVVWRRLYTYTRLASRRDETENCMHACMYVCMYVLLCVFLASNFSPLWLVCVFYFFLFFSLLSCTGVAEVSLDIGKREHYTSWVCFIRMTTLFFMHVEIKRHKTRTKREREKKKKSQNICPTQGPEEKKKGKKKERKRKEKKRKEKSKIT